MKYFWIIICLIITGCTAHVKPIVKTAVPPEVSVPAPILKIIPHDNICIVVTNISNENLPHSSWEKFVKNHRVVDATFLAGRFWNLATNDYFIWKPDPGGHCSKTIYIIITQTNDGWNKLKKVYPVDPKEVGFTVVNKNLIFIRPDIVSGKYGFRSLVVVLTHEMGHAIGLDHVDSEDDIMNESFDFKNINDMICLNGCLKSGKETISNFKNIYEIEGKEVILF